MTAPAAASHRQLACSEFDIDSSVLPIPVSVEELIPTYKLYM